jgi:hypothetical protein
MCLGAKIVKEGEGNRCTAFLFEIWTSVRSPNHCLKAPIFAPLTARRWGQWTLIGTRSNIIVSDLFRQRTGHGINFFDFTPIAATVFVGCATYFFLFGGGFCRKRRSNRWSRNWARNI